MEFLNLLYGLALLLFFLICFSLLVMASDHDRR